MTGTPVRVGFLGAGFISTFHSKLLALAETPVERVGVFDPDAGRAERFVTAARGGSVAGSVDEVIDGADAVYVCTWTSAHEDLVARCVDAGVAVFCEKPLGVDLAQSERVADLLTGSGRTHQVGLVLRWSPAYALAEALLADRDATGEVMAVTLRDDQTLPTGGRYASAWRAEADKAGSGVLLEHSIHDLDLLDRLVGPITGVTAHQRSFHGIDGIEDLVVGTYPLAGGGVASLTTVWHDNPDRNSLRYLEVHAERAFLSVTEDWFGPVRWAPAGGPVQEWVGDGLLAECARRGLGTPVPDAEFVAAVAEGRPGHPDAEVARRAHRLCDATYRSAAAGGSPVDGLG